MDFNKLKSTTRQRNPIDPLRIFETLPSLDDTPNDLWRGQAGALVDWHQVRENEDVLITLNTGAGKTIVGLLVAQSLLNELSDNVVYACSTIDLCNQTAREAERIGIPCTLRTRGEFTNELFEGGRAFCVTTYAAIFNGHSAIRRSHFPKAVIFDDAHVAESLLRDSFTIRVSKQDHDELFGCLAALFEPHFDDLGVPERFADSLDDTKDAACLVSPDFLYRNVDQLRGIFNDYGLSRDDSLKFPYAWLKDRLHSCAGLFNRGVFELTPPFLPSRALDVFGPGLRRVYLSATLESLTDFVRAFGRIPDQTIEPHNDAGNGERLILDLGKLEEGTDAVGLASRLTDRRKAVIAVGSYRDAQRWSALAAPPDPAQFSNRLEQFRAGNRGAFILVNRVDGIDLPHETCRAMIIDGLPSGNGLLERFQWHFLRMNRGSRVRIANRLTQLFGRINRGRNDYGVFLVLGRELRTWLANDSNLALLPALLRRQVLIGRAVQEGFTVSDEKGLFSLVDAVLGRDNDWLDYYQREIQLATLDAEAAATQREAEKALLKATIAEAKYSAAMWRGDALKAAQALQVSTEQTSEHDTTLGGWHLLWRGAALCFAGDDEAGRIEYQRAAQRLGEWVTLPRRAPTGPRAISASPLTPFGAALDAAVSYRHEEAYKDILRTRRKAIGSIANGSAKQAEEGLRTLGEMLGFRATRPDNEVGTGPDVVWSDDENAQVLGFELKTDKESSQYNKKEVGQGHDHLQWLKENYAGCDLMGLVFVGRATEVSPRSNPSKEMMRCATSTVHGLGTRLISLTEDIRAELPISRRARIREVSEAPDWTLRRLMEELGCRSLS